jgi:hypothetical protein
MMVSALLVRYRRCSFEDTRGTFYASPPAGRAAAGMVVVKAAPVAHLWGHFTLVPFSMAEEKQF